VVYLKLNVFLAFFLKWIDRFTRFNKWNAQTLTVPTDTLLEIVKRETVNFIVVAVESTFSCVF